ncbi:zinc ribbon domain-containing protein [uncultured Clostridium sp.]|uniref:zinc ribbon domain-containing protein n=1 Tax=uncultured Clostridium sp. TaxID=59620 RepID=UPI0025D836B6|nr:zinc ribbon domain-containing protein [uncultured Clostridium sp.]
MFCPKCGKELKGTPKFCTYCGTPIMGEIDNAAFEETNAAEGHSSRSRAASSAHIASAKTVSLGIPAKIGIGAAAICLIAGSAAFGSHMAHRRNSTGTIVATEESTETLEETTLAETTTEAIGKTEEIQQTEEIVAESTEDPESVRIRETNQQAVAAYRKYLSDRMYLPDNPEPGEEGRIGEFCLVDLNQDGVFELFADNLNLHTYTVTRTTIFLYYNDSLKYEQVLGDYVMYNFQNQKIISWSEHGCIDIVSYQYSGDALTEIGEWSLIDNPWLMTENELLETIDDAIRVSGNDAGYTGTFVPLTEENLKKYLSSSGIATGNGEMKHLNEDILARLKDAWYEMKKYKDEETAATEP